VKSSRPAVDRDPDARVPAVAVPSVDGGEPTPAEGGTRRAVARLLMEQGPCTAAAVASALALSAPAVRRHLDALLDAGEAEMRDALRRGPRGRGRPAREYLLTDAGRARFGHGYDDLAVSALRFLAEHGGESAVRAFAEHRTVELLGPPERVTAGAATTTDRVTALARVLAARGYAAQIREVGAVAGGRPGVQLCQHHCPVAHVAAQFPELCEAETRAFAELLGTHVQRLSTIARGGAACTTHVPLEAPELLGSDRSAARGSATHSVRGGPPADGSTTTTAPARPDGDDRKAVPHDDRS
jgi:predicted ArsR family transcriptional regulator